MTNHFSVNKYEHAYKVLFPSWKINSLKTGKSVKIISGYYHQLDILIIYLKLK